MNFKESISKVNSWSDFKELLGSKTKQEKGQAFEELTKYFLEYNPVYKSKLKKVWFQREIPSSLTKKLNLPSNDQGIDLIAQTHEGTYWAIQCKYLHDENQRLSHRAISTFVSLSSGIAENISHCLVCTTVDNYASIYKGKNNIGFINSDEWRKLDEEFFDWIRSKIKGQEKKLTPYKPKSHQVKAIKEAKQYFINENNSRGKLIFPCGAGKSLTGYWIVKELMPKSVIVAVPSLSLVKQTLEVYLRESVANNENISWLCVCSDEGIGTNDDIAIYTCDIGVPCVTDKKFIARWIQENSNKKTIIFTTYQSGKTISEACKIVNHEFDLGIMDEAHKTVGDKTKLFSHLLLDSNIKIKKRIFMTATERRYAGSSDVVLSMEDVNVYGDTFTQISFKEAIEIGILSDYKIITLFISNDEVKRLIEKNAFVKPTGKSWDNDTEARTLASLIALRKAMTEYPIHHAVTFHSSIKKAEAFEQSQQIFSSVYTKYTDVKSFHVSGSMPTSTRSKIVDEFSRSDRAIITNAKCLTEGVDVPNIDCVLFADPRKSTVDIVQALGRALRIKEGKEFGYVILPVFTESTVHDEIINSDEFKEILSTLRALASNDERIIEYFKDLSKGIKKSKNESLVQFNIDVQLSELINESELIESIHLKTWDKIAKLSWMTFDEARCFVRAFNFKSKTFYDAYFNKKENKQYNLPAAPGKFYDSKGWINWGDYLGTNNIATFNRQYLSYSNAQNFVAKLKLKSYSDWIVYLRSGEKPDNIPAKPSRTYEGKGWVSFGHWLGTGTVATNMRTYLEFSEAKEIVLKMQMKSVGEWIAFTKSPQFPANLPKAPDQYYSKNGDWISYGDWLGNDRIATNDIKFLPFSKALKIVHSLNLKSNKEWASYCKINNLPTGIPKAPAIVYSNSGWINWGHWLGTNRKATNEIVYVDYTTAKNILKKHNIKTFREYKQFIINFSSEYSLPSVPVRTYKNEWLGSKDFFGK